MTENTEYDYNAELDKYIEQLKSCKYIQDDRAVKKLCEKAKELLSKEENIIYLNAPITVRKNKKYLNIDMWWYSWTILWFNRII